MRDGKRAKNRNLTFEIRPLAPLLFGAVQCRESLPQKEVPVLTLARVRLVNWHNFEDAVVEIGNRCLLAGDNGCFYSK